MTSSPPLFDRLLDQTRRLYSLPAVAVQVLNLTSQEDLDTGELKRTIEQDPALSVRVLRVVNSSLFGMSNRVLDLNQALTLLGVKPLKLLVLGFSLPSRLFADLAGDLLGRYWKQTLTQAVAAREVSQRVWGLPGDEAFTAGLLKDLGRLVLIQGLGQPYVRFMHRVDETDGDLRTLERRVIGFDHLQLTVGLLKQWELPQPLIEAIDAVAAAHETGESPQGRMLGQILYLADLVATLLTDNKPALLAKVLGSSRSFQRLSESELRELAGAIDKTVPQLANVLALELPGGASYQDILLQAHEQLSHVAGEAAGELAVAGRNRPAPPVEKWMELAEVKSLSDAAADYSRTDFSKIVAPPASERNDKKTAEAPARTAANGGRAGADSAAGSPALTASESGLVARLTQAVIHSRQARQPISLLLAELDPFKEPAVLGRRTATTPPQRLRAACKALDRHGPVACQESDTQWALILPGIDRRQALELGRHLRQQMSERAPGDDEESATLSIGLASVNVPSRNFAPDELLASAERCLHGAQLSGGNCIKSIEIY